MQQTAYKTLQTIGRIRVPYVGGFCRWWYTPIQNIAVFPLIDPLTQMLVAEPTLKVNTTWYGPVNVPDSQLGWDEDLQQGKAGHWYKEKVYGFIPGMDAASHINLENLAYHQLVVVGKVRAGGNYYVIGSDISGLDLTLNTSTGQGAMGTPGTKLTLSGESISKACLLTGFAPSDSLRPPGTSSTPPASNLPDMEIITFTDVSSVTVAYNSTRRNRFGDFPDIEVWLLDIATNRYFKNTSAEILVDNPPPNQTSFTVKPGPNSTGFIVLN